MYGNCVVQTALTAAGHGPGTGEQEEVYEHLFVGEKMFGHCRVHTASQRQGMVQ